MSASERQRHHGAGEQPARPASDPGLERRDRRLSLHGGGERRYYRAEMPESAIPPRGLRERRRRRDALADLSDALAHHLEDPDVCGDRAEWARWAARLAAGIETAPAPDGTHWLLRPIVEFL